VKRTTQKGQAAGALTAGQLGARYFVEGTLRSAGTVVRLNARTNAHLWAEIYERSASFGCGSCVG
jgi:TolB-like protein